MVIENIYNWELKKLKHWSTNQIKNWLWLHVSTGQPVPGSISVEALRTALILRGEEPVGYHNT